jgi:hypothetical protein
MVTHVTRPSWKFYYEDAVVYFLGIVVWRQPCYPRLYVTVVFVPDFWESLQFLCHVVTDQGGGLFLTCFQQRVYRAFTRHGLQNTTASRFQNAGENRPNCDDLFTAFWR